ncbi:hypothetical protein niasHS_007700 [Heterodera schachtii]|uniref:Uncharacterized protein n=1 Tax=Heterodera schachtii TaxID=97005 RepID=A0ABD2JPE3_HETSC
MNKSQIVAIAVVLFATIIAMDMFLMTTAQCIYNPDTNSCDDPGLTCNTGCLQDDTTCNCGWSPQNALNGSQK